MKAKTVKVDLPDIRKVNWVLIIICFFLPAVRGCQDEVIIPYQHMMHRPEADWTIPLMYLYPLILLATSWLVFGRLKERMRYGVLWGILYAAALGLTFLLFEIVKDTAWPLEMGVVFVLIWGIVFLGLARCKDPAGLMKLLSFTVTAFALWFFPVRCYFADEILIGGWLYIFANATILLTYLIEYGKGGRRGPPLRP